MVRRCMRRTWAEMETLAALEAEAEGERGGDLDRHRSRTLIARFPAKCT